MKRIGRQLSNDELRAYEDQTPKVYSVKLIELQRNFIRLLATGWVQFWYVKKNLEEEPAAPSCHRHAEPGADPSRALAEGEHRHAQAHAALPLLRL